MRTLALLVLCFACSESEARWLEPGGPEAERLAEIHYTRGVRSVAIRDFNGALFYFSRTLRLDPDHARAYHQLGRSRFAPRNRRFAHTFEPPLQDAAVRHYSRAIDYDPDRAETYELRAWVRLAQSAILKATADFAKAVALDTDHLHEFRDGTHATHDAEAALAYLDAEVEARPTEALLWFKRGNAKLALDDREGALADYEMSAVLRPNLFLPRLARADVRIRAREFEAALEDLEAARDLLEEHPATHELLGWAHYLSGDSRAAVEAFSRSLELRPDDRRTFVRRGLAHYELGDGRAALDDLTRAHRVDPTRLFELGVPAAEPTRPEVALPRYEARLTEEGEEPAGLFLLANALHRSGRDFEAVEAFTRCLELAPGFALGHLSRGVVHARMQDEYAALADFDEALRLDPGLARAHVGRGNIRFVYGETERAREEYVAAIELAPEFAWAHRNFGLTLLSSDPLGAIDAFTRAIALDEEFAEAYEDRARAHLAAGNAPAAWWDRRMAEDLREAGP